MKNANSIYHPDNKDGIADRNTTSIQAAINSRNTLNVLFFSTANPEFPASPY